MSDDFRLVVWGARGSRQVSDPRMTRYGGDTTCFEVRAGDHSLVIDCGSGALNLEEDLLRREVRDIDMLLTHSHLDHLIGLPFFCMCYMPHSEIRVHVGHLEPGVRGDKPFQALFDPLLFPVSMKLLKAMKIQRFHAPHEVSIGPFAVSTMMLNHPGGAVGYRISHGNRSVAIITDHEHGNQAIDGQLAKFIAGSDLVIMDTMYTDEEYSQRVGWGHATPQAGIDIARVAGIERLLMTHHAPWRTDNEIDTQVSELRAQLPGLGAAAAGQSHAIG